MRHRLLRFLTLALAVLTMLAVALPATVPASGSSSTSSAVAAKKKKKKATCKKAKKKKSKARHSTATAAKKKSKKKASCKKKKKKKIGKPGTPKPPALPDLTPRDYLKTAGLSQPVFDAIEAVKQTLTVKHDGVDIYLEITKPKGATNLGVILEASGYHGTLYPRTGTRILPGPVDKQGNAVGLVGYFPQRGYAVVMMDVRGTGKSRGCLDHLGDNDAQDIKEVVEWAAAQPWSNGRVGILGHSYVGGTSVVATKLNPKGLVTSVVSAGLASIYDHQWLAGVPWNLQWAGPIEAYEELAIYRKLPPQTPAGPLGGGAAGDDFGNNIEDTGCGMQNSAIVSGPAQYTGQEADFHKQRDSSKQAIAWPGHVFLIHGVHDQAARIASMAWFNARHNPGDKLFIGQWDHGIGCCPNQRGRQWTAALNAWFDRQLLLKDVDTGPPVEAYLNDVSDDAGSIPARKEVVTASQWPVPARTVDFATGSGNSITEGAASGSGSVTFTGDARGYNDAESTGKVEFTSKPFTKDMLFLGEPKLDLSVATTLQRTDLIVNVFDVSPDGNKRRMTHFAMNPLLRNGIDTLTPVTPGQQMLLKPPGFNVAHHMRAGHTMMLRVVTSDPDHVPFGIVDPQVTVFYGQGGTILHVPVVDDPTYYPDKAPVGGKPAGGGGA